jgi:hypothetical protein
MRGKRFLALIAKALSTADPHSDGRSLVSVSPMVLTAWSKRLEEMIAPKKGRGRDSKTDMHKEWALSYWCHRALAPEDVKGAVSIVQNLTRYGFPAEPEPKAATITRVARKYRSAVFKRIDHDNPRDLARLREYLSKRERRGRQ